MNGASAHTQFAISKWVNDQLEDSSPPCEIPTPHRDFDGYPSWQSDPASGITGTVYLAPETVYYSISYPAPDQTGWWEIGELPEALRGDES